MSNRKRLIKGPNGVLNKKERRNENNCKHRNAVNYPLPGGKCYI